MQIIHNRVLRISGRPSSPTTPGRGGSCRDRPAPCRGGRERPVVGTGRPRTDGSGECAIALGSAREKLTQHRRAERALDFPERAGQVAVKTAELPRVLRQPEGAPVEASPRLHGPDHLQHGDCLRRTADHESAVGTSLPSHYACPGKQGEDLREIARGDPRGMGDLVRRERDPGCGPQQDGGSERVLGGLGDHEGPAKKVDMHIRISINMRFPGRASSPFAGNGTCPSHGGPLSGSGFYSTTWTRGGRRSRPIRGSSSPPAPAPGTRYPAPPPSATPRARPPAARTRRRGSSRPPPPRGARAAPGFPRAAGDPGSG